ncbi:putative WRKY transcription factor 64 [Silene latifolia]|uniref:putative WRKY transcription factor 64 n=1 Tax=Silene latifolia TaxID=37657 RepID=UPI003D77828B
MENQLNITPKLSLNTIMEKVIDEMEKGKECTDILRNILLEKPRLNVDGDDHDYFKVLDHHCRVTLTSFLTSLSLIRSCDFNGDFVGKRKLLVDEDHDHCVGGQIKYQHLYGELPSHPTHTKGGRGSYKRRKMNEGRIEEVTDLREDGFGWRKYGQKVILNANHPRNYYRCTHKFDKKCPATKQVQQISDNPTKYRIIYHGNHICNYNLLIQSPIVIDDHNISSEIQHPSTIVLRFDQKNQVNPLLFPNSASPAMKQEYNSPPLSDQSTSQDQTVTTGHSSSSIVSEQSDLVSTAENQAEDDSMWTDLEVLHDLFDC